VNADSTAQAATAILESGAIMLGAALVFVTVFRRLKLGATLQAHHVNPELFDSQRHALESLKRRRKSRHTPAGSGR
jgi:hypothetical protein